MRIHWSSRQGTQRERNSDAVTLGQNRQLLVCLLVDAAERTAASQTFARHWGLRIVPQVLATWRGQPDPVLALLNDEQGALRRDFLLEVASYSLLCLDRDMATVHVFQVGDCLVGERQGDALEWWSRPHTLATWPPAQNDSHSRHLLTRSLNAKRFCLPELHIRPFVPGTRLVMATDGYWAECLQDSMKQGNCLDDASYLQIEAGDATFSHDTDTDNFCRVDQQGGSFR